jgi:hypothetical protein
MKDIRFHAYESIQNSNKMPKLCMQYYKFYNTAVHASVPLMSVDLVTIAVTRAPDLHPPGASRTYLAKEKPDDTNTTNTSLL